MIKIKVAGVSVAAWCLVAVVVVLVAEMHETAAVTCNPTDLSSCLLAITGSQQPSAGCCSKLEEQVPACYCEYLKNTMLRQYMESANATRVASTCGLPIPTC